VLCLQEIRVQPEQLTRAQHQKVADLNPVWHPAQRAGYSGVATFSQDLPLESHLGLGIDRFDREGRVIRSRYPGFQLFNVYVPNGGRSQDRLAFKLDFYAALLDRCDELHARGEKVIICGDFNTAHQEIDLRNPRENQENSGFLPEERAWIDRYLEHGFVDAYRELYPDRAQYTWWTYRYNARARNIGWRLDYFLVSRDLMPLVEDVVVHTDVMGSDHCPVSFYLKI
jgi:exodeoxyribonuclease-3